VHISGGIPRDDIEWRDGGDQWQFISKRRFQVAGERTIIMRAPKTSMYDTEYLLFILV
jgi:hypothetical protein